MSAINIKYYKNFKHCLHNGIRGNNRCKEYAEISHQSKLSKFKAIIKHLHKLKCHCLDILAFCDTEARTKIEIVKQSARGTCLHILILIHKEIFVSNWTSNALNCNLHIPILIHKELFVSKWI